MELNKKQTNTFGSYYIGTEVGRYMITIYEATNTANLFDHVIQNDSLRKYIREYVLAILCPESREILVLSLDERDGKTFAMPLMIDITCLDTFPFRETEADMLKIFSFRDFISNLQLDDLLF